MADGKKGRKFGRNSAFCKTYRSMDQELRNKKRKLGRYIRNFPEDKQAQKDYARLFGSGSVDGLLASLTKKAKRRARHFTKLEAA